ncbi:DNA polymerase [Sphingomonas jaspsi]|uniref:DNA polymerase n=1 Tax=Sphingomonas jaspsi TaxID=392409 RepID=UPI0004AC973A|nr:DNA polymerase [Sphingomonas jaspsi]
MHIASRLLDKRSSEADFQQALDDLETAVVLGLDCETTDEDTAHEGIQNYRNKKRWVFDHRRTTMTGFSFYAEGSDTAWYVNLAHADVENRLPRRKADVLLSAIREDALILAHNAPFELCMFQQCLGVKLANVLCTLQLAVSHHGPDEYDPQIFYATPLTNFAKHTRNIERAFANYDPETRGRSLSSEQQELLSLFIGKTSTAAHSYNGFVSEIAFGYNLKKLVQSLFGFKMTTYDEVLKKAGATHMGQLTGEQVVEYGADDAYWAVRVFQHLKDDMLRSNPELLKTFLTQENPMVKVFADSWREGMRLDLSEVYTRRDMERAAMADVLRSFKPLVKAYLPFPDEPNAKLIEKQGKWYEGYDKDTGASKDNWKKLRKRIEDWANSPNSADDFEQLIQSANPVGDAWANERGVKTPANRLNPVYYQGMRMILHDLMGLPLVYLDGEISTDKEARGKMLLKAEKAGDERAIEVLKAYQRMADVEQTVKLYLTPYTQLMDPETSRVYPSLSSMLATRRMAISFPNVMAISKYSESKYVRGFYLGDDEDHLVVSADWSSIELVDIGEKSGDHGFREVFGQLPYGDLHSGAAADCLAVKTLPGLTEEEYREFKFGRNPNNRVLKHIFTGQEMTPKDFHKLTRGTPVGKGANFNYWYSGSLSTVGMNLGWSPDEMWEAVDRYRTRFPLAEAWRVRTQQEAVEYGFVQLPDHHRRVRLEATPAWHACMMRKFADISASPAMLAYAELALKRIQSRAKNQAVNGKVQGSCAALAKRAILRVLAEIERRGWQGKVRFMVPIHDELVWSVHRDLVPEFIPVLRWCMTDHKDLYPTLPLHCTVSVGRTFKPYDEKNPAFSQIELDEAPHIEGLIAKELEGSALTDDIVARVVKFVADARMAA